MNKINNDKILKFTPLIKRFIAIVLIGTLIIVFSIIRIIGGREITYSEWMLTLFNFIFIAMIIGICFFIIKVYRSFKKNIYSKLKDLEQSDILYNVRNKFKFIVDAEEHINNNIEKRYALAHYDINKFSIINNSVGYKIGDEILMQIGMILNDNFVNEVFGKAEGDNFFVLFEYSEQDELVSRIKNITEKIEGLDIWNEVNIKPAIMAGICFIDNENVDVRSAIDKAIFAKGDLKSEYKSSYAIYNDSIGNNLIEVKKLEDGMYGALERNEFEVYMQPKVDLKTGEISGAEALVRWNHPELGLLNPIRFIPIFEKNGFITKLDKFVFEQVCLYLRSWLNLGYHVVPVSVNVSRIHFLNANFVHDYNKIKENYNIPDNLIEIEITESVVFSNEKEDEIFTVMRKFRNDGFDISMDDFGSGYSCLGLLKDMPIDTLKLDKIFLEHIEDYSSQIIVNNIVNMAKNLNLNVISEGVETDMQVDFLRDIGCDMAQGFIFEKPIPISEFNALICNGRKKYKLPASECVYRKGDTPLT
ncbi:GGDEF domain-containing phosphodiesterase [Sedimentibacter sp.]|uniref:putative bifunctional diguanylate cyclase/phosphodiesterase n=1 Tax=Sedimentibacter sp. TaxID=1960295 RepID=UPI0028A8F3ED|nr:GGDEF domain-containing phosphodiesterase [Sedimentibacter sp.]